MKLMLAPTCPIFDEPNRLYLDRVLAAVGRGWHVIAHPPINLLSELLPADAWNTYQEILKQGVKRATYGTITASPSCDSCDAEALADALTSPLRIVVEDAGTDGGWIALVARVLGYPRLHRMLTKLPHPMVETRHAGGIGQIPTDLARATAVTPAWPEFGRHRVVALCDSDGHRPGERSTQASAVRRAADQLNATAHVWSKRTIENYLPDDLLREFANSRRDRESAVALVLELDRTARDCYPIKDGLKLEEKQDCADIYPADLETGIGIGDVMSDVLKILPVGIFPQGFERAMRRA